jgi:hypothetical protein
MKNVLTILVALLFACSLTGSGFAEEPAVPVPEQPKVEEKAPAAAVEEVKEKVEKKEESKTEQQTETKQESAPAPAAR